MRGIVVIWAETRGHRSLFHCCKVVATEGLQCRSEVVHLYVGMKSKTRWRREQVEGSQQGGGGHV